MGFLRNRSRRKESEDGDANSLQRILEDERSIGESVNSVLAAEVLNSIDDAVILVGLDGTIQYWTSAAERMYGWASDDVVGRRIEMVLATEFPTPMEEINSALSEAGEWNGDLIDHHRDGHALTVFSRQRARRGPDGEVIGVVEVNTDVTERRSEQLRTIRLTTVLEAVEEAVVGIDRDGAISAWNQGAERLYGYTEPEAVGRNAIDLLSAEEDASARAEREAKLFAGGLTVKNEVRDICKDGRIVDVSATISPIKDERGVVIGLARICHDITEYRRIESELRQLAHIDALTGLWNRRRLEGELAQRVSDYHRYGQSSAVVVFDLDGLKAINDTHGHVIGDDYLRSLTELLGERLRRGDMMFRYGGDEFVVLASGSADGSIGKFAEALRNAVAAHSLPVDGSVVTCTASIGVADVSLTVSPGQSELRGGTDDWARGAGDCLIEAADMAMYEAKQAGGNSVRIASPSGITTFAD